ncbi:hypothetical protein QCA50_012631 [Cerrena zonata]|uniref:Fungal-type protein kinase domain-containing protein n=1 Tax=Cerrena zonata TaxID=2478898 RepID=A0AAW0FVX1_9APHY
MADSTPTLLEFPPDTKYTHTPLKRTGPSTTKITAAMEHEISMHQRTEKGMSASSDVMLKRLMPVDNQVLERLFDHCVKKKLYDPGDTRWVNMPESPIGKEVLMYEPVREICNFISAAIQAGIGGRDLKTGVNGVWNVLPDRAPHTRDESSADTRPDIDFAITSADRSQLCKQINEYIQISKNGGMLPMDAMQRWWLQLHAVFELKRVNTENEVKTATIQVITGMRRILREQFNRRFVFGVTLCQEDLCVWLCDRSGLLGMDKPINIHTNAIQFIQVIAAFSILPPDRLGWDPTMQLYSPVKNCFYLPYLQNFDIKDYGVSAYDTHWLIEMPAKGSPAEGREKFLTVRCLSAEQADGANNRGTIVWEVVKLTEMYNPKKVYVLKQSWRPSIMESPDKNKEDCDKLKDPKKTYVFKQSQEPSILESPDRSEDYTHQIEERSEAAMFSHIQKTLANPDPILQEVCHELDQNTDCSHVAAMYSFEDVHINGCKDTTFDFIRQGLKLQELPRLGQDSQPTAGQKQSRGGAFRQYTWEITVVRGQVRRASSATKPIPRTHTRIVEESYGWPIKYFLDLKELLQVFGHGIRGHRFLYLFCWILHQDVSHSNLLISAGLSYDPYHDETTGVLIDLDHAKIAPAGRRLYDVKSESSRDPGWLLYALCTVVERDFAIMLWERVIADDPTLTPFNGSGLLLTYLSQYLCTTKLLAEKDVKGDFKTPLLRPCFELAPHRQNERTGTIPFMSAEVLDVSPTLTLQTRNTTPFTHDAVHDIESFFWVFLYICLTWAGPGNTRRKDLDPKVQHIILSLYDGTSSEISRNKARMFRSNMLETEVLPAIHPYFESLHGFLSQWFGLLRRAHEYHLIERDNIHNLTLKLIDSELENIPVETKETAIMLTEQERKRRKDDIDRIRRTFLATRGLSTPPIPSQPLFLDCSPGVALEEPDTQFGIQEPQSPDSPSPPPKKLKKGTS